MGRFGKLTWKNEAWTKRQILVYTIVWSSCLALQLLLFFFQDKIAPNPDYSTGWFGVTITRPAFVVVVLAMAMVAAFFTYFWCSFCMSKGDPVGEDGKPLTVFDNEYMSVETAPFLGAFLVFAVANILGLLADQTASWSPAESGRKVFGGLLAPYWYDEAGVFDETWYQSIISFGMLLMTVPVVICVANAGKLRYFLPATTGMFVRPFYLLAMYYVNLAYGETQEALNQSNLERVEHATLALNMMWGFYFGIPLALGLFNAYVLKVQWEPGREKLWRNLLVFVVMPGVILACVAIYLTWGVSERFDLIVFGVPCTPKNSWPSGPLGKGECSPFGSNADVFSYLTQSFSTEMWVFLIWILAYVSPRICKCQIFNDSFFAIFVIIGMSQVRFILTECTGIPFAMRTIIMNYESKNWLIGIPTTTVNTDLLAFLLFFGLCKCGKKMQDEGQWLTIPIGVFKTRFAFAIPMYFLFTSSQQFGMEPTYAMTLSEAFIYVFGVAVPAYHVWNYGFLRTMSCLVAREYEDCKEYIPASLSRGCLISTERF